MKVKRLLLGDKAEAAKLLPFAERRLERLRSRMEKAGRGFAEDIFRIDGGYVRLQIFADLGVVTINIREGIRYEFMASEFVSADTLSSPPYDQPPFGPHVDARAILYRPKSKRVEDEGQVFDQTEQYENLTVFTWQPSKTSPSVHYPNPKYLGVESREMLRYNQNAALRMHQGNFITLLDNLVRFNGYKTPPYLFKKGDLVNWIASAPDYTTFLADPNSRDVNSIGMVKPTNDWWHTSCIQFVGDRAFFVMTDTYGKSVKVFPAVRTIPEDATVSKEIQIPFPAWADPDQPGIRQHNSGFTWNFNRNGTKMVTVLHELTPAEFGEASPGNNIDQGDPVIMRFEDADGNYNPSLQHEPFTVPPPPFSYQAGTYDQQFNDPYTIGQQLYMTRPGVVEIEVKITVTGEEDDDYSVELNVIQELRDKYYYAADYHMRSQELVTAELECFTPDGTLYGLNEPEDPQIDPERVNTDIAVDMVLNQHVPDDQGNITVEEKRRFMVLKTRLNHSYSSNPAADTLVEFFAYDYDEDPGAYVYEFRLGAMDLRALAYWGTSIYRVPTQRAQSGQVITDFWYSHIEANAYNEEPRIKYAREEFDIPSRPDNYLPVDPFNSVSQAVVSTNLKGLILSTFAVSYDKKSNAWALCTPVTYAFIGTLDGTFDNVEAVPMYLDIISYRGVDRTHEEVYNEVAAELQLPVRDWSYYGAIVTGWPDTTRNFGLWRTRDDLGCFAVGGLWIPGDR